MRKISVTKWLAAAAFIVGVGSLSMGSGPGLALGTEVFGGGGASTGAAGSAQATPQGGRSDRELYNAGYWLAQAGKYDEALQVLRQAQDKNNPAILNYIGYSLRKKGQVDEALTYYQKAITIAPDYTLARSYMGEAFLQKGDTVRAKEQLTQIQQRCGTNCEEYGKLAKAIQDWEAKRRG